MGGVDCDGIQFSPHPPSLLLLHCPDPLSRCLSGLPSMSWCLYQHSTDKNTPLTTADTICHLFQTKKDLSSFSLLCSLLYSVSVLSHRSMEVLSSADVLLKPFNSTPSPGKVLLGGLRRFVHLLNSTKDELCKGYDPVEFEVTTAQVSRKSDPGPWPLETMQHAQCTVLESNYGPCKSQVYNLGKNSDVLLPSKCFEKD